jgi:Fibronectin type III domain
MRAMPTRPAVRPAVVMIIALGLPVLSPVAAASGTNDPPQVIRVHGGGYDRAGAIAVDDAANAYLGGSVETADSAITFAVVKLDPQGRVVWTAHYTGSRGGVGGQAQSVTVDDAGNVYAAGYVSDGVIFNTNYDYLVVKFGSDGVQQWAQRYNGPGNNADFATRVVVDAAGGVYATGFSYGQNYDWATLKFAPDGTQQWLRRHSGPGWGDDRPADMVLAPGGNLVITGFSKNTGDNLTNDAETLSYDPHGGLVWQQRWTDTVASHEVPTDMDVDAAGRIAITGATAESASPYAVPAPVTLRYDAAGALTQTIRNVAAGGESVDSDGAGNVFLAGSFFGTPEASSVARYDPAGNLVWSTPITIGANDALSGLRLAAHATGAVTVAGTVSDLSTGNGDYLTIRYAADGHEMWRHRFSGLDLRQDQLAAIAVDPTDAALVTGTSWNGYLSIGGTADDIVTLKFPAGAAPPLVAPVNLDATALSRSQIRLRWQDNGGTEDGFRIERCQGVACTTFAEIAVVEHDMTTYVDSGLLRNTAYTYRVRAFNAGGGSGYSNTATAKTRRR